MKKILSVTMILLLVFSMASCGGSGTESDGIKVGWIGALSGGQAAYGICESQALQMYIDEQNAAGGILGKQIELGAKTAAVLYDAASSYSRNFTEYFVRAFESRGGCGNPGLSGEIW